MKPQWDAEAAEKAAKLNRENMLILAKETGTPVSNVVIFSQCNIGKTSSFLDILYYISILKHSTIFIKYPPTSKGTICGCYNWRS